MNKLEKELKVLNKAEDTETFEILTVEQDSLQIIVIDRAYFKNETLAEMGAF